MPVFENNRELRDRAPILFMAAWVESVNALSSRGQGTDLDYEAFLDAGKEVFFGFSESELGASFWTRALQSEDTDLSALFSPAKVEAIENMVRKYISENPDSRIKDMAFKYMGIYRPEQIGDGEKEVTRRVLESLNDTALLEMQGFDKRMPAIRKYFRQTNVIGDFSTLFGKEAAELVEEIMLDLEKEEKPFTKTKKEKAARTAPVFDRKELKSFEDWFSELKMLIVTDGAEQEISKLRAKVKRKLRRMHKDGGVETVKQAFALARKLEESENIVIFEPKDKIWDFADKEVETKESVELVEAEESAESDDLVSLDVEDIDLSDIEISFDEEGEDDDLGLPDDIDLEDIGDLLDD